MTRVGVVGVGHLGKEHARVYAGLDNVDLVGVVDTDPERAREVSERFQLRPCHGVDDLLPEVDAVSIVVPTPRHLEAARPFLEAGKAVLVEKPLADTLEAATTMIDLAREHRTKLQVGHIERFNPVLVAALPHIQDPVFIECDRIHPFSLRSTDVSVVLDLMIHDLDLVLHLTDDEIEDVDALGASVLSPSEDLALARLEFRGGCISLVKTSRVAIQRSRKIRIFCERSYVSLDLVAKKGARTYLRDGYDPRDFVNETGRIEAPEGESAFLARMLSWESLEIPRYEPLMAELSAFVDVVRDGTTPLVTGEQGRRAMSTAGQIEARMKFHRDRLAARRKSRGGSP